MHSYEGHFQSLLTQQQKVRSWCSNMPIFC